MTTNIFIHDCIDPPRLEKLRALPDARINVIECDDEDEDWHLPDDRPAETHVLVSSAAPDNLGAMTSLQLFQISSVGFGQLIGWGSPSAGSGLAMRRAYSMCQLPSGTSP